MLTVALEGAAEELVTDATAIEWGASVRRLDWPKELQAADVDYTVLNQVRGNLLPRNWPEMSCSVGPAGIWGSSAPKTVQIGLSPMWIS